MAAPEKPWKAEYAKSARAACRTCRSNIAKEILRFGKMVQSPHFDGFMPMWHHATCIMKKANQIKSIDEIEGIESLRWEDQQKIRKYVDSNGLDSNTVATAPASAPAAYDRLSGWQSLSSSDQASVQAAAKGKAPSAESGLGSSEKSLKDSKTRDGAKRKNAGGSDQDAKIVKTDADMMIRKCGSLTKALDSGDAALESRLEAQTRALWDLKDDLKKHVSTVELRQMLQANEQSTSGSELDLRDRCADGMMFGALKRCPMCSGHLSFSGGMYKCHGFISEWSKCSYSTNQPERIKGKWKLPEETDNQYLLKWFKSQKAAKPVRILPPSASNTSAGNHSANGQLKSSKDEKLEDLRVAIAGLPKETVEEFRSKIEGAGGQVHAKIKKDTNCLVVGGGLSDQHAELKKARRMKIPIVREEYLVNCIQKQKKLPFNLYKMEATEESSSMVTVKVKGRSAVHEASGLQDSGHILEEGPSIYNTILSLSDLSSGINRLDYGINKQAPKKNLDDSNSKLAPALKELIKMLFNVETYRAAMLEFEINLSEMPLGKLSKSNIQQGFEALTQIQNLLENTGLQSSVKESLIVDASNRFFTMIPSIHPHVIRDEDDFKSKVKMLEALQDIEIASRLVGFDADSDEPLDAKYKKLHCDMVPLSHDSEDYRLIEKYLLTTHAPTHTEWSLELEEVFSLEREGELDKFAPQREKLGNRMLLWHGSRLTNFVGILSQGLRIAPPEAPATGYMFGKGVYFADLVSKSAQYCFTDKKNPVGLMLLSEVALGQVHERKKAQYMDKPPRGKHSTKGLGKKVPDEAGFAKWRDEVVVPCGKPVDSKVKTSELMYNEYIVYDTAQVKMQYLLKVRFRYKR
uniref:Poly [ADP-ribose] polymerase n=1 Tax=Chenopodium quinoa TaxID=63459 RepID=A0A803LFE6_CHEQI